MAHVTENRIIETSTTAGTGPLALTGAVPTFRTFASKMAIGDTCHYAIYEVDASGSPSGAYEYGRGTYSAANTLSRTLVVGSSNGDALVDFANGAKHVSLTVLAPSTAALQADWRQAIDATPPNRNLLQCPTFRVNQRATTPVTLNQARVADRWQYLGAGLGTLSLSASSFAPPDCIGSVRIETTAAGAIATNQRNCISQGIEGFDVELLQYGAATAASVCMSFWVYSSRIGTFSSCLLQSGTTSYTYVKPWTVNAANTWERKTLVVPGNAAAALLTGTAAALYVRFAFAAGSSSGAAAGVAETWAPSVLWGLAGQTCLTDTVGSVMYISSPKLERGSVATISEPPDYRDELRDAMRFLEPVSGSSTASRPLKTHYPFKVPKRAPPTLSLLSGSMSGADYVVNDVSGIVSPSVTAATATSDWVVLASSEI